ncbi:MAG: radical SAM family heme chaperone HemW, partial [Planctomycetota bacterium]
PAGFVPETVFVGGGTPTELGEDDLERMLALVAAKVRKDALTEWTCEANPGTLTPRKVRLLLEAGVTRLSLGVQSFDDRNLQFLGRIHDARAAREAVAIARGEGMANLSIDLIAAIPNSSLQILESDLEEAVRLGVDHISCYSLIFEQGTPLHAWRAQGLVAEAPEDDEVAQYQLTRRLLTERGYRQYEISNYHKDDPARETRCLHNLLYWGAGGFHAVGPGAHGHVDRERYANVRNLEQWQSAWIEGRGSEARSFTERLEPEAWAKEALIMALRRTEGVRCLDFARETGHDPRTLAKEGIERSVGKGWLEVASVAGASEAGQAGDVGDVDDAWLRLTSTGVLFSDSVFMELL